MIRILEKIFVFSLFSFLLLGTTLVLTQLFGLIIQQGVLIIKINDLLTKPTFVLSAIAGLLGFIISAIKNKTSNILTEEEQEEKTFT